MGNRSRYAGGPRALGTVLPQATDPIIRRRGFQNGEILARWAEIVGRDIAEKSCPEQLSYSHGSTIGGILHVRVEGAMGLELQHIESVIVERINTFFGHAAVSRLKLVQAPLPRKQTRKSEQVLEITTAKHEALDKVVAGVKDEKLRVSLRALGERIAERQK